MTWAIRTCAQHIASLLEARANCASSNNMEWFERHNARLTYLERNFLPSGSGVDIGTKIDRFRSSRTKLVLHTAFHHMSDDGFYSGWTDHDVIVTPSFDGCDIRITGRDKRQIKDYLADLFHHALSRKLEVQEDDTFVEAKEDQA